jgi:antitoxin VapB
LIIEPVPSQASLLDVLAKLPRLEERIPDVDAGLPELDDVEL